MICFGSRRTEVLIAVHCSIVRHLLCCDMSTRICTACSGLFYLFIYFFPAILLAVFPPSDLSLYICCGLDVAFGGVFCQIGFSSLLKEFSIAGW